MKQMFFTLMVFLFFAHGAIGQNVQTWTYSVSCSQNPEYCEKFYDQLIISFDSTRIALVYLKNSEASERVIVDLIADSLYYVLDSLELVYCGPINVQSESSDSLVVLSLDSIYSETVLGVVSNVVVGSISHENETVSLKSWIDTSGVEVPFSVGVQFGLLPFVNNINRLMPHRSILKTENVALSFEIEYVLSSFTTSQGASLLNMHDSMAIRSLSSLY